MTSEMPLGLAVSKSNVKSEPAGMFFYSKLSKFYIKILYNFYGIL